MSEFEKMMEDINNVLAKAQAVESDDAEGADEKIADAAGDDKDDPEAIMKSFAVTLADGTEAEAYDATAVLKAMGATLAATREDNKRLTGQMEAMAKAMTTLTNTVASQATMLKSLGSQPAGRRSVAQDTTPPPQALNRQDVLAKAMTAMQAGKIGSLEVSSIETRLNKGLALTPELARAIGVAA